jgi:hypothetical protein
MRMPGFTADQSLYRQTASYSAAKSRTAVGGSAVVPQFDFGCIFECGTCLFTCGLDPACWLAKCGPGCLRCIPT